MQTNTKYSSLCKSTLTLSPRVVCARDKRDTIEISLIINDMMGTRLKKSFPFIIIIQETRTLKLPLTRTIIA